MEKQILIIEDNQADIELIESVVEQLEGTYRLHTFTNAIEPLDLLLRGKLKVDLILLDLNLPKMNGIEFMVKLRSIEPPTGIIPITIISTSNSKSDITKAYKAGANNYISKPLDYNSFKHLISQLLDFWLNAIQTP